MTRDQHCWPSMSDISIYQYVTGFIITFWLPDITGNLLHLLPEYLLFVFVLHSVIIASFLHSSFSKLIVLCAVFVTQHIENNWRTGQHLLQRIYCHSETSKGVYCLQYDDNKIISGLRDNTIKVFRLKHLTLCSVTESVAFFQQTPV